jgi:hypothetical protein
MESPRRPFGVTVIATAMVANALIAAVRVYLNGFDFEQYLRPDAYFDLAGPLFGVLGIVFSIGLWRLRRWAWVAVMLWAGLNMTQALVSYFRGDQQYVAMALSVVIVLYLNQREVQLAFIEVTRELIRNE